MRDFYSVFVGLGSITSEQHVRRVRGMSASPPIASKLRRRSESTWCADCVAKTILPVRARKIDSRSGVNAQR